MRSGDILLADGWKRTNLSILNPPILVVCVHIRKPYYIPLIGHDSTRNNDQPSINGARKSVLAKETCAPLG